jgi:hypothetical protein
MKLRAGDYVIVRSAAEIEATLDDTGSLEGVPFMPEMVAYCGTAHRVFKRIDKIIDIVQHTGLRRMNSTVTLDSLRCDGSAHGGCQSGCQLLWKEAWLKRCSRREAQRALEPAQSASPGLLSRLETVVSTSPRAVYRCQATELFKASSYFHRWDPRQYLLPLWYGNVTFVEFLRGISVELFNRIQRLRKGCEYPYWIGNRTDKTPTGSLGLRAGDWVRVRSKDEILQTLDGENRNRGLWFDREMVRYCGQRFRVLRRVEKLIKEKTGSLHELKNPSVILDGVTARGEFYRFNPQHDYLLWRDVWLERADAGAADEPPR